MIEKIFFKFMGLVIIILALWSIKEEHDNTNKYYAPLQERAAYLLALDCQPQQCVQTGEIEYLKTDVTLSKLPPLRPRIYLYRYTFEVDNRKYHSDLKVFSERHGTNICRSPNHFGKDIPGKILYDPKTQHQPTRRLCKSISSQIPNPYNHAPLLPYGFMFFGLIWTWYFVFGEGRKVTEK